MFIILKPIYQEIDSDEYSEIEVNPEDGFVKVVKTEREAIDFVAQQNKKYTDYKTQHSLVSENRSAIQYPFSLKMEEIVLKIKNLFLKASYYGHPQMYNHHERASVSSLY
jgi:hypothetical protein